MKHIVVVGCSRGIGFELVKILSKNHRVLALSRNLNSLQNINENVIPQSFDIADSNAKETLTKLVDKHLKTVDVLINTAGLLINKPVLELDINDLQNTFNTNIIGLIQSCQAIVPFMKKNKGGHIVNIGSMGGFQGSSKFPGLSAYSSSKSAVAGFTECLAEELAEDNVKANCLALGAAQTEMLEEAFPGYVAPISAKKMAEFIADFALNSSQWINGKVIPVSISTP
jgi:short-subunit dehydrogenase